MKVRSTLTIVALGAVGLAGCDAGGFVTSAGLDVPVQVSVDVASLEVGGVSVRVTGPGISEPIIANLPVSHGSASGTVTVLAGSSRNFQLRAFDTQAIETHRGEATRDINGEATTLDVSLTPITTDIDVDGRIGSYTVAVSAPSSSLGVGQTAQLTVAVTDAYGNAVPGAQVTWGSSNPAVASVNSTGLVEGRVAGETTIAASYMGFSGTLTLAVQ